MEKLLKKLRLRDDVSVEEEAALTAAATEMLDVPGSRVIVNRNVQQTRSLLLISGFVVRYKDLRNGQRQILEVHVPGDFVDLHSFTLKWLEHDVATLSASRFLCFPHENLKRITEEQPHLTRMLWFSTMLDASIAREAMLSLGRRSAAQRLAHLFCELHARLATVGMTQGDSYGVPLNQIDLAEITGLTPVHVNRMLRQLREDDLVTFRDERVVIHDHDRLRRLAEFREDYLHIRHLPR